MSNPCIAYNEHRVAPALSVLGRTDESEVERRKNRNAARNRRAKLARVKGPRQPAPAPMRMRAVIRSLYVAGKRAAKRGDTETVKRVTRELNAIYTERMRAAVTK